MKTNNLKYTTEKTIGNKTIIVKIRLNDECKNGHQDFSITGDIYNAGKPRNDRNHIAGGCIHEDILKHFPEFKIFVDLHLSDYMGIPMHAIANGYYHLREGFNSTKVQDPDFSKEYCEYYRITFPQFLKLTGAESEAHFGILLGELNIFEQWKKQAYTAIKYLEELTAKEFLIDSKRTNLDHKYTDGTLFEEERKRIADGYYSDENKNDRLNAKRTEQRNAIISSAKKEIENINKELQFKLCLFDIGGLELIEKAIYYKHNNSVHFNWREYQSDKISKEEAESVISKLPFKVTSYKVS